MTNQATIKSWPHEGFLYEHDIVAYGGGDWFSRPPLAPLSKNWVILSNSLSDEEVKGG